MLAAWGVLLAVSLAACIVPAACQELAGSAEVPVEEVRVYELRSRLERDPEDAAAEDALDRALAALHALPAYRAVGNLAPSSLQYGTNMLVANQARITEAQRGMLLFDSPVQFLDVPSMKLPTPRMKPKWAAYNPSVIPVDWLGQRALLVTYRVSTWHLCAWSGQGSPVSKLPLVRGKRTVTSKIAAAIFKEDFSVLLPVRDVEDIAHKEHWCEHHTGMLRVGVDDGRLFTLRGRPWMLYAAVALQGQTSFCLHRMLLCRLVLPSAKDGSVRCVDQRVLQFDQADEISEAARAQGRLAQVHQKNWSPIVSEDQLYLVFTAEPFTVLRVDVATGRCVQVSQAAVPALRAFRAAAPQDPTQHSTLGAHGGSPYVRLPDPNGREWLGIGRVARGNTRYVLFFHTVLLLGSGEATRFAVSRVSPLFCFPSTAPPHAGLCETIQFAGGLVVQGDDLMVTYGTNDCEAKVAFVPLRRVLSLLLPATI